MERTRFKIVLVALLGLLVLAAAPIAAAQKTDLTGAGSTFVYPIMTRWIADYQKTNPEVQINYQSIGSGGGIQQLKNGLVDFGASDVALTDRQLSGMSALVQIPENARAGLHHLQFAQPVEAAAAFRQNFGGNLSWHDKTVERRLDRQAESRRELAQYPDSGGASLRWKRNNGNLYQLSFHG